jgi:membrane fusion protein, multidrug efflux system
MTESTPAIDPARAARDLSAPGPRHVVVALLAVLAVGASAWWVYDRVTHVHIADARIAATMITISSRVAGWLEEMPVETGDRVRRGDLLLVVDDREAELALREAELGIASARANRQRLDAERALLEISVDTRVQRLRADRRAAESARAAAETELERMQAEWQRAGSLLERDMISRELFEQQRSAHRLAEQNLLTASARVEAAAAAVAEAEAARFELDVIETRRAHAELAILDAEARRDQLAVALSHHRIHSPIDGVIDTVFVDPGEYVERGRQLLILHDPDTVWVSANVRETQIRHLRPGTRAHIRVDAYPGRAIEGVVRRVGQAATNQFSLLPSTNPGGNFTKVTQRIEVRIDVEQEPDQGVLKPGMMVEVKIGI